jgi:hypothetical protein
MNAFHDMGAAKVRKSPVRRRPTLREHTGIVTGLRNQLEAAEASAKRSYFVGFAFGVAGCAVPFLIGHYF